MNPMISIYAELIRTEHKTIEQVPTLLREQVRAYLEDNAK
ncbi:CD1375 family protein [Sporosarcina koreensis]|nr:CD1375 family protein [Sporosarcina koreensis]